MTFAWPSQTSSIVDESVAVEMIQKFMNFNKNLGRIDNRIDTARIYAGGKTEQMLGEILPKVRTPSGTKITVGTKAHPSVKPDGLSEEGINEQLRMSLKEMKVASVGEYYLHQPDAEHSLLESLKCAHSLIIKGKISAIGMSNYHASEMTRAFELCSEYNLTPPTVYQGLYNPLNRVIEEELLPVLERNGCSFVAYNPLAAGLLSGKHEDLNNVCQGRFKDNQNYLPRFYTAANFKALNLIRKRCEIDGLSMVEASYRWLLRHSGLKETDGILIGASSLNQLDQNLEACMSASEKDSLSQEMLDTFDEAWELTKASSFPYWRSYSMDMPNLASLDMGASYSAAKIK